MKLINNILENILPQLEELKVELISINDNESIEFLKHK